MLGCKLLRWRSSTTDCAVASQHQRAVPCLHQTSCRLQVVDCRRILKWTYTYGYYTFGEHADKGSVSKQSPAQLKSTQEFFEFNQVLPR